MAKAIAEAFKQQTDVSAVTEHLTSSLLNIKGVTPSNKDVIKPISVATAMNQGTASVTGNEND